MTTESYDLLLPEADPLTQPWWDALRRHELVIQACADCGTLRHIPKPVCAECGSEGIDWRRMTGAATLYSFVIVHRATLPAWRGKGPYNVALIALDDAPHIRLHGNVVGVDDADLKVGMPLVAIFDDVTGDDTILRWTQPPA